MSLFSGVGGFDLAFERAGMTCIGQAENDPACLRVLGHHWPAVRRWDDVRDVGNTEQQSAQPKRKRGADRAGLGRAADYVEGQPHDAQARVASAARTGDVDLICGGFPCQDVSVAGQRAGLDGARSGLWFEFQRILSELRPRWAVVENVPGLLSSNGGRDFAVILDGLGKCGFGGIAWAVLDSQHFGVAQRRRRVFIVCGPTRRSAEQILSLCESCGGHPQTGRTAGQGAAGEIEDGVAKPLGAKRDGGWRGDLDNDTYITASTLDTHLGDKQWLEDQSVEKFAEVMDAISVRTAQTGANGIGVQSDMAYTLDGTQQAIAHTLRADGFDASEDGTGRGTPLVSVSLTGGGADSPQSGRIWQGTAPTLDRAVVPATFTGAAVRRLTPTECLRLQGFPDDWLDIEPPLADGPKYRMTGNAVTVSTVEWIGKRIVAIDQASLRRGGLEEV